MKKAIGMTELILLFLAIIAGGGLLLFGKQSVEKVGCMRDVEICKTSLLFYKKLREQWGVVGKLLTPPPRVDCVAVSPPNCDEKKIKVSGNEQAKKQQAMHVIAENMRWCWHKTLGKENTVGEDFGEVSYAWALTNPGIFALMLGGRPDVDFCLVCSEFDMPDDVSITPDEWNRYLDKKIPRDEKTYVQYIEPFKGDQDILKKIWNKDLDYRNIGFAAKQKYYVVSVSAEESVGDKGVFIYISPELYCGTVDPQIHYQLR